MILSKNLCRKLRMFKKGMITMKKIKLSEIKIIDSFLNTTPNPEKVQKYRNYYNENKEQAKLILLDHDNFLRDGYIQYLILKENGVEEATVMRKKNYKRYIKREKKPSYRKIETTYIFGKHPNSSCQREFCWRVPASWGDWAKHIQVGDTILCSTKFGYSPVVVSNIKTLNKCPIDLPIKRICSKEIRRNGEVVEF